MAGKKGSNYGNPGTVKYWKAKGYSEEEAIEKKNSFWRELKERKIKEHGSEEAYREYRSKNCSLKKENAIKRFNGDEEAYLKWKKENGQKGYKLYQIEYWINQGYSEKEAKQKIHELGKKYSVRTKEYWINQGYSEEEAVERLHEIQDNCSLVSFQNRYGEEEGTLKYESYLSKIKETTLFNDSDFQKEMASRTRYASNNRYWVEKGYSEEEAEEQRKLYIKENNPQFPEYYERLGFSIEEAIQLSHNFQVKASASRKFLPTSRIEQEVFYWVMDNLDPTARKTKIYDVKQRRFFFPDIQTDTYIIEVYGDYWHANPKVYEETALFSTGKTSKDVWKIDKARKTRLSNLTGLPVFVVWEKDLIEKGIEQALKDVLGEVYEACKKK